VHRDIRGFRFASEFGPRLALTLGFGDEAFMALGI
jgi:hypothetical protein